MPFTRSAPRILASIVLPLIASAYPAEFATGETIVLPQIGAEVTVDLGLGAVDPDGAPRDDSTFLFSARAYALDASSFLDPSDQSRGTDPSLTIVPGGGPPEGDGPADVEYTPDGTRVLIAHRESGNVTIWNADGTYDTTVDVSGSPQGVAVSPDGSLAITANLFEDSVSFIDLGTNTETTVIPVGDQPTNVVINPSGTRAAVVNAVDGDVSILELPSGTELRRIAGVDITGGFSFNFESAAVSFRFWPVRFVDDTILMHADFFGDEILFIDVETGGINIVPVDDAPQTFALSADRSTAVVTHTGSNQKVSVIDTATQSVTKVISTGINVNAAVAVDATGSKAVVAVQNAVRVVNLITDAVSADINTASVNELYSTSDGLYAFCVGFNGSLVSYASESLVKNLNTVVSCSFGDVSPTATRAAIVADTFGEDLLFVDTNGAAGFLELQTLSGPSPEADKCRLAAANPTGTRAAVSQILSDNIGFFDLEGLSYLGDAAAGNRPADVAFTPDGSEVVVANLDSPFCTIIDASTLASTNVPLSTRGNQVEISPDGQYAYISVVTSDGVWRVDLDTQTLAGPRIATGNMGGVGYLYNRSSGMTLSHDGSVLVVCGSFTNNISFIDTATWSLLGNTVVGDFPTRATFRADDSKLYVSCKNDDTIRVLDVATRTLESTIPVGDQPFETVLSPDGDFLYVLNYGNQNVGVVDLGLGVQLRVVPLPDTPGGLRLSSDGESLLVPTGTTTVSFGPGPLITTSSSGDFNVIDRTVETVESIDSGVPGATLAVTEAGGRVVVPGPNIDGIYVVEFLDPASSPEMVSTAMRASIQPHPVANEALVRFLNPAYGMVRVTVHDVNGRVVESLLAEERDTGVVELTWSPSESLASSGVYFLRVKTSTHETERRLVVR